MKFVKEHPLAALLMAAAVLLLMLVSTGCQGKASTSARAYASSSTGQFDKAYAQNLMKQCFLTQAPTLTKQAKLAHLLVSPTQPGQDARGKLTECLKVPADRRTDFDNKSQKAISDAVFSTSFAHHPLKTAETLFTETLPELAVQEQQASNHKG